MLRCAMFFHEIPKFTFTLRNYHGGSPFWDKLKVITALFASITKIANATYLT